MKYINLKTIGPNNFQVWACHDGTNTVVMVNRHTGKFDFNRKAVGLRVKKGYQPPADTPGSFTREEAIHVAHQIGRYMFNLGDLVYTYTYVDELQNDKFFEEYVRKTMPRSASRELLIDGDLIEPLLAMWIARMTKMELMEKSFNRNDPLYDELRIAWKKANQAHSKLTSLHVYQKRSEVASAKVQSQLRIAATCHRKADLIYNQFLNNWRESR